MIVIALHQDGVAEVVSPSRLFQGSDSEKVFVLSPYPSSCPVQITAVTKKGENVTTNGSHVPMRLVNNSPYNVMTRVELPADFAAVSVTLWEYDPPVAWTAEWGTLCICGLVQIPKYGKDERRAGAPYAYKNLTTFSCEVLVEETVVPALPTVDDVDAYAELLAIVTEYERILGSIDDAPTQDSGNLVLSGGTYQAIETAKEEAVDTAKGYTDEKIAEITGDVGIVNGVKGNAEAEYRHGNVNITPANIGLGNVDNTSDLNKPVSTAQQTALDGKVNKKPDGTNDLINGNNKVNNVYLPDFLLGQVLYGGTFAATTATATLSTNAKSRLGTSNNTVVLTNDTSAVTGYEANEGIYYIATDSGTFAGLAIVTGDWLISNGSAWAKIDNTDAVQSVAGKTGAVVLDKSDVGLGNVDNTSDMDKPVSTAQQTALNAKQNTLTFDSTPTAGSNNPVTSDGILAAIISGGSASFDSVPTKNSQNPVRSNGIYEATHKKVYRAISDLTSATAPTIADLWGLMETDSVAQIGVYTGQIANLPAIGTLYLSRSKISGTGSVRTAYSAILISSEGNIYTSGLVTTSSPTAASGTLTQKTKYMHSINVSQPTGSTTYVYDIYFSFVSTDKTPITSVQDIIIEAGSRGAPLIGVSGIFKDTVLSNDIATVYKAEITGIGTNAPELDIVYHFANTMDVLLLGASDTSIVTDTVVQI